MLRLFKKNKWFSNGHMIPALIGYLIVILFFIDETFDILSLVFVIVALFMMIYYFVVDFYFRGEVDDFAKFGFSALYMGVIYFKSRNIFNKW